MTKEQILEKVKKNMKSIDLDFNKNIGIECWDKETEEDLDGALREIFRVFFKTLDTNIKYNDKGELISLIEGFYSSCYVDAKTYEILYYTTEHGYLLPDGSSIRL